MNMKIYIDTEFNGYNGQLISMALIDENGKEWYEVLPFGELDAWVNKHVKPVLNKEPIGCKIDFQRNLEFYLSQYDSIHIVSDWPEDIKYFCDVLITGPGTRINTPPLTIEVRRDLNTLASLIPHNALADVRAMRLLDINMDIIKG